MKKAINFSLIIFLAFILFLSLSIFPQKALAFSWQQVNIDGFGDANNEEIFHMVIHGGYIYAGVSNNNGAQVWRSSNGTTWNSVNTDGFGDTNNYQLVSGISFNGSIYLGTSMLIIPNGAEIWYSATGDTGSWLQANTTGFGDFNNHEISAMAIFNNRLYAATVNLNTGTEVWSSANGTSWTQSGSDGLGVVGNTGIYAMKVFGNYLYAGTNSSGGSRIYRTADGVIWNEVNSGGFGDSHNNQIDMFEYYAGYIYAGTSNVTTGAELWRSASGDAGSWTQVGSDGFGDSNNIYFGYHGVINRNLFMIGLRNDTTGGEMWGTYGGVWTQEGADGFGDANNSAPYATTFMDRIYIAFTNTSTGAEIWRSEYIGGMSILPSDGNLTSGTQGSAYQYLISVDSAADPVSYSLLSGSLPPGLSLSQFGLISGTPTATGEFCFQINAIDSGTPAMTDNANYCINIVPARLPTTGKDLISYINFALGIIINSDN